MTAAQSYYVSNNREKKEILDRRAVVLCWHRNHFPTRQNNIHLVWMVWLRCSQYKKGMET